MEVTIQHLADELRLAVFGYHVHDAELRYVDGQKGQDAIIDLRAGCATGIEEMELLVRIFKSHDMQIPAWENVNPGCDTCGDDSLSLLDGLTIKDVCSLETSLYEVALIRWEQDLDRKERERLQRLAQQQADRERKERKQQHLAEQIRARKLREQQEELFQNDLDEVFDQLWNIYDPLRTLRGREFHEKILPLPRDIRILLNGFRKTKPENQTYQFIKQRFLGRCEKGPKKMKKILFPQGKRVNLRYRTIRLETDQKMRIKRRALELEGFIVF